MKRLMVIIACILAIGLVGCQKEAKAEGVSLIDELKKFPALNQCVIFSVDNKETQYASTITLASLFKERVNLDIGWTPKQEVITAISYKLVEVKDYINFPILKYIVIEPMVYIGWDRLGVTHAQNEFDWGAGCKVLEVKF